MSNECRERTRSFRRVAAALAVLVASASGVCAQPGRADPPAWFDLETELHQRGVKTDTASLIGIAQSKANVGMRWSAIEILGLRKEQRASPVLAKLLNTTND